MAEKVKKLALQRDYGKWLYYIDGSGNICRKNKSCGAEPEIMLANVVERDSNYLYFIDRDGDVARSKRGRVGHD